MKPKWGVNAEELYPKSVRILHRGAPRTLFGDPSGPDLAPPEALGSRPGPQLGYYTDPGTFAEPKSGPSAAYMQRIEGASRTEGKVLSPAPVPV